ncbi:DUF2516 family protein [Oerskovia flava]|uniref:DUF2516 family protein n=1 Tax=Oerskovia flava TaxID=2986422 RepID=UPI002240B399|nr:DUF2516 family protein [Oerskovia sp. JB1-3-2]
MNLFGAAQNFVLLVLTIVVFVTQLVALIDAARRPAGAFTAEGKLSKPIWLAILGVAAAIGFIGIGGGIGFFSIIAVVPAMIYLVDVRPRLTPYSRGQGNGPAGGSGW